MPSAVSHRSRPRMLMMIESTTRTAMLVARKRNIRFIWLFSLRRLESGRILRFQDRPRTLFRDHVSRRIGVARGDAREDRGIDHPQALQAVHAQLVVHYRHTVSAHLAGAH